MVCLAALSLSLVNQRYCALIPLFTLFLYSTVPLCRRKHFRRQSLKIVSIVNMRCQRVRVIYEYERDFIS
jgi:hypothetical protein